MPQNIIEKTSPTWVSGTAPAQGDFIDPDAMALDLSKLAERDAWLKMLIKNVCDQQGVTLNDTETSGLLSALDARYFKNAQLGAQATDAEVAAAIVAHLGVADPHPQYTTETEVKTIAWGAGQTSAPWIKSYPSGSTVPTVYAGDVIYIGTDKYEWIGGVYVQIKPIAARAFIYATNTTSSLTAVINAPKAGLLYFTASKNVSTYTGTNGYKLDMFVNGSVVSSDTCSHSIANSVAINVGAGTHTILLAGNHVSSYSMWLSVLYVPH